MNEQALHEFHLNVKFVMYLKISLMCSHGVKDKQGSHDWETHYTHLGILTCEESQGQLFFWEEAYVKK